MTGTNGEFGVTTEKSTVTPRVPVTEIWLVAGNPPGAIAPTAAIKVSNRHARRRSSVQSGLVAASVAAVIVPLAAPPMITAIFTSLCAVVGGRVSFGKRLPSFG